MAKRNKFTIDEVHSFAQSKGGECLSNVYHNMNLPMVWKCDNPNHKKWEMPFNNVIKGSWCPECRIERFVLPLKEKIAKNGGKWISGEYINSYTKIKVQCERNHIWFAKPNSIMRGIWCSQCAHDRKKAKTLTTLYDMVEEKNGKVLSERYNNSISKVKIECQYGHVFHTTQSKISQGVWCPECAVKNRLGDFKQIQNIARERGGECISKIYKGAHSKLKFQCVNGHIWEAKRVIVKCCV